MTQYDMNSSDDEWADILSEQRRRYLLYCLHLYTSPLTLTDIAHQLAVWETPGAETIDMDKRQQIYTSLSHDHLPALVDANLITYESDADMVIRGSAADAIEPALSRALPTDIDYLLAAEGKLIRSPES